MKHEQTFSYQQALADHGRTGEIMRQNGRQVLRVEYTHETNDQKRFQTLPLPLFFDSFEQMNQRELALEWKRGTTSKEVYAGLLEGLNAYISLRYPGFLVVTPIKIYEERAHGAHWKSAIQLISVNGLMDEMNIEAARSQYRYGTKWTGGFSNVVMVSPDAGYMYNINEIPRFPHNDGIPMVFILPVIDFDIEATGRPEVDLAEAAGLLQKNGLSGYLIQSGDAGRGGYHFVADFIMPHTPHMWQSIGRFMNMFMRDEEPNLRQISNAIETASSLEEAQEAASHLLSCDKIRARSWPYSHIDMRHGAHSLTHNNMAVLRALPAKSYTKLPHVVGEIH